MARKKSAKVTLDEAKRFLRTVLVRKRQSLTSLQQKKLSKKIIENLLSLKEIKKAKVIASFIGFGSEVITDGFIQELWKKNKQVLVPITQKGFDRPYFVLFKKEDKLFETKYGPFELTEKKQAFPFGKIDVVIVPGLGFDKDGYRVGYGGGVYDRILAKTPKAHHIGVFFSIQKLHAIPHNQFDQPLHAIITESKVIRFNKNN